MRWQKVCSARHGTAAEAAAKALNAVDNGTGGLALSFPGHPSRIVVCHLSEARAVIDISRSDRRKIAVLGAPIDIGASQRGTLMGPAALRTAGLLAVLEGLGFDVKDHGDLSISEVLEPGDAAP